MKTIINLVRVIIASCAIIEVIFRIRKYMADNKVLGTLSYPGEFFEANYVNGFRWKIDGVWGGEVKVDFKDDNLKDYHFIRITRQGKGTKYSVQILDKNLKYVHGVMNFIPA